MGRYGPHCDGQSKTAMKLLRPKRGVKLLRPKRGIKLLRAERILRLLRSKGSFEHSPVAVLNVSPVSAYRGSLGQNLAV